MVCYHQSAKNVSIHATLAGGDRHRFSIANRLTGVSIHATLAGGDADGLTKPQLITRFYPRHPRGWRLAEMDAAAKAQAVSIHATLAGGDDIFFVKVVSGLQFLSTPPSRVATVLILILGLIV